MALGKGYRTHITRLKGAAQIILFLVFTISPMLFASAVNKHIPVGEYGTIVARHDDIIQGAVVEKINLYPIEFEGSVKRIERNGLLVRYKDAVGTVLMCHGFMCDKYDQGFLRRIFPRGRYNLMTFDFRAHGEKAAGQSCTLGRDEAFDVLAAANFLKNHPDLHGKPLFVYGFSMGAVAAIEAQAKDPSLFQAMVLDCPFDSSENVLKRGLDRVKFSILGYEFSLPGRNILQKYAFHPYIQSFVKAILKTVAKMDPRNINVQLYPVFPAKSVEKIAVPSFFILCKNDEKVSVDAMKTIYRGSGAKYKQLWLTNGRGHFDSYFYNPEQYTDRVRSFLDLALTDSFNQNQQQGIIEDVDDEVTILVERGNP